MGMHQLQPGTRVYTDTAPHTLPRLHFHAYRGVCVRAWLGLTAARTRAGLPMHDAHPVTACMRRQPHDTTTMPEDADILAWLGGQRGWGRALGHAKLAGTGSWQLLLTQSTAI